jgi:hypothetical protein
VDVGKIVPRLLVPRLDRGNSPPIEGYSRQGSGDSSTEALMNRENADAQSSLVMDAHEALTAAVTKLREATTAAGKTGASSTLKGHKDRLALLTEEARDIRRRVGDVREDLGG